MEESINQYILMAIPWIKTIVWLALGLGLTIGVGYYLFIVKRRRTWICNLWELKADNRLHYIGRDIIVERKINKGKQVIYVMKKARIEVMPPNWECSYRHRNKEYTDYIRIVEDDFRPARRLVSNELKTKDGLLKKANSVKDAMFDIKHLPKEDVFNKYLYCQCNNSLVAGLEFDTLDYDINMMRINAIDNRDKIYADKQDFLQKYGTLIALGVIVVLIIVVLYLSYDYSSNVISSAMGQAKETTGMIQELAAKMGGTPPPS